jgi:outer membrane protein
MNIFINILVLVLIFTGLPITAGELRVQLYNSPESGTLVFQIYDSADSFGDFRSPARELKLTANEQGIYLIPDAGKGVLALLVYHDENSNGKLDRNFIGIPREFIAISNNYRPKGPPSFDPASFTLGAMESKQIDIEMFRVLGRRGQIGLGVGIIGKSTPYVDSTKSAYQVIPAISYLGERLQIFGPNLQLGLLGSDEFRLALSATYRIASYDEEDSEILTGLGDRKSTLMLGPALIYEWQNGIEFKANYQNDVLDEVGGSIAVIGLSRGFQLGPARINPGVSLTWMSGKMSNHDFGVPETAAIPERPAYVAGSVLIPGINVSSFIELIEKWQLILNMRGEVLPDEITGSPIVEDDLIFSGNAILAYLF